MSDVALFMAIPHLRCGFLVNDGRAIYCGDLAYWETRGNPFELTRFFCDRHRHPSDVAIAGDVIFRRLTFHLDVLLASATLAAGVGQADAFDQLEAAVTALGGLVNLHSVTSVVGRAVPPAPSPGRPLGTGRP